MGASCRRKLLTNKPNKKVNQMRKNYSKAFKTLLLSCADNSNYSDNEFLTDKEKEAFLVETFKNEMSWSIKQGDVFKSARNWLRGLASACTVPFYTDEIQAFMADIEYSKAKDNDDAVDHYWSRMAKEVTKLYFKYNK